MNSKQMKALGINEVFLTIDGFESNEVSNYGNVRNSKTGVHKSLRKMNKVIILLTCIMISMCVVLRRFID